MSTYQSSGEEPTGVATAEAGDRPGAGEAPTTAERFRLSGTDLDEASRATPQSARARDFRGEPVGPAILLPLRQFVGDETMTLRTSVFPRRDWRRGCPCCPTTSCLVARGIRRCRHRRARQARRAHPPRSLLPPGRPSPSQRARRAQPRAHRRDLPRGDRRGDARGPSRPLVFDHTARRSQQTSAWRHAVGEASRRVRRRAGPAAPDSGPRCWRPRHAAARSRGTDGRSARGPAPRRAASSAPPSTSCTTTPHRPITPADVARAAGITPACSSTLCAPRDTTRRLLPQDPARPRDAELARVAHRRPPSGRSPSSGASATSAASPPPTRRASASSPGATLRGDGRRALSAPAPRPRPAAKRQRPPWESPEPCAELRGPCV